jgi:hypothetical protein
MHRVVDDEVGAKLVDDIRVGLTPIFREILGDDLEILSFFLGRHFDLIWKTDAVRKSNYVAEVAWMI